VQDGFGAGAADDFEMKEGLRRWPPVSRRSQYDLTVATDLENLRGIHTAFVDRTGGDGKAQRFRCEYRAEISACAEHPAPVVEVPAKTDEFGSDFRGFT